MRHKYYIIVHIELLVLREPLGCCIGESKGKRKKGKEEGGGREKRRREEGKRERREGEEEGGGRVRSSIYSMSLITGGIYHTYP